MAVPGLANAIARCTVDELVEFSGETEVPKYMKIFILQQIAEARRYVNVLGEEAVTARSCLAQLNVMISDMEVMDDHMEVTDIHKWTKTKAIRTKPSMRLEEHEQMKPTSGNLLNRTPRDALTIIENKSKVHTSKNKLIVSKQATVKAIEETCMTYGGPHLYYECLATAGNTFDTCASVGPYIQGGNGYRPQGDPNYHASNQMRPPGFPPLNVQNSQNYNQNRSIAYPAGIAEDVFMQVGMFTFPADFVVIDYDVDPRVPLILGRPFLRTAHALIDVHVEELILRDGDEKLIFHADSTSKHPHKHGNESVNMINFIQVPIPEPNVSPNPNPKTSIPYPSRLNDQKLREKTNSRMLKFLQIIQRLHFDLSFVDALLYIPKFASTFKSLLSNKEKLLELANTSLTENCSAVLLKK
nr:reverse transcriptase domain-containing protein [Tanacetum cinerariifolium]